jgi:large subunit ribosomal protein L21
MYAIVKTGGKQYRVEPGQRLLVERLAAAEGETVALEPLMYRSDEVVCDAGALSDVKVAAKVIEHPRGEKLRVFKFKPKRGYKRRTGHRQELTMIEVTDISFGGKGAKAKAAPKQKAPAQPKAEAAEATSSQEAENGS